jgi:hypothetical protein
VPVHHAQRKIDLRISDYLAVVNTGAEINGGQRGGITLIDRFNNFSLDMTSGDLHAI